MAHRARLRRSVASLRKQREAVTILLVDGDPLARSRLLALLNLAGYTVMTAANGPSAMALTRSTAFDLLITDIATLAIDGFCLTRELAEGQPVPPRLLISGIDPDALPLRTNFLQSWSFNPTPVDRSQLVRTIDASCLGEA